MKDRKNQYSIGEVAALLNISPQTLRFYDKSGVVVPDFIDQIQAIDITATIRSAISAG